MTVTEIANLMNDIASGDLVTIPRAEYEAYRAAAKEWMTVHASCGEEDRCECEMCASDNKIYDALRSAGIHETEGGEK